MPGPKCGICAHPQRAQAEIALAKGQSLRAVAERFRLSRQALTRHQAKCAPRSVAKVQAAASATEARELELGANLIAEVRVLQATTQEIMADALRGVPLLTRDGAPLLDPKQQPILVRDGALALKAIAQARRNLELIARLGGTLDPKVAEGPRLSTYLEFEAIYVRFFAERALNGEKIHG